MQFSQQEIEIENVCADASDIRLESSASLCEVCKKGSVVPVGRETQMVVYTRSGTRRGVHIEKRCNNRSLPHAWTSEHERFSSFRKGLEGIQKSGKGTKCKETKEKPKKKGLNCYLLFAEENRNQVKAGNPGKPALEITKILSQMWQNLSVSQKNKYKEKAKLQASQNAEKCPKCEQTFESQTLVINHMMSVHMTQTDIASSSSTATPIASSSSTATPI